MRILSSFKDFYDFVVTETDNRKVYLRETKEVVYTEEAFNKNPEKSFLSPIPLVKFSRGRYDSHMLVFEHGYIGTVAFCDKLRHYLKYKDVMYWNFEDIPEEVLKKVKPPKSRWSNWESPKEQKSYSKYSWWRDPLKDMFINKSLGWVLDRHTKEPIKTELNKLFQAPVMWMKDGIFNHPVINPKLSDIGFNKAMSPTEAYQDIYNWIPYNEPEVPNSPDDMSRYESKGFDKKTSFRPNMKND